MVIISAHSRVSTHVKGVNEKLNFQHARKGKEEGIFWPISPASLVGKNLTCEFFPIENYS